jgi:hypothetical protein
VEDGKASRIEREVGTALAGIEGASLQDAAMGEVTRCEDDSRQRQDIADAPRGDLGGQGRQLDLADHSTTSAIPLAGMRTVPRRSAQHCNATPTGKDAGWR